MTNKDLSAVTDEFIWSSSLNDIIFQCINELTVTFNTIDIGDLSSDTDKYNSCSRTIKNGGNIGIDNITCNAFSTSIDIECGIRRLEGFLKHSTSRKTSILSSMLKGKLYNVGRKPSKVRSELMIVGITTCSDLGNK